jgi:hypothetical protein
MIAHRETHPEWPSSPSGFRLWIALLMAVLLLLLYALVHAAAAASIDVPAPYLSAGGFIATAGCWLFALSARTLRAAWARLALAAGLVTLVAGAMLLTAATWPEGGPGHLPIEVPWSLQATWGSLVHATVIAIATVCLGLTLLIVAYGLHRQAGTDDRATPHRAARKQP